MSPAKKYKPNIQTLADADTVARRCLELFIAAARRTIEKKNVFYLAISGGHSPQRFFELLGKDPVAKTLAWDKVQLFWVDERYVPHDSPYSNYKLAADAFLTKVPIPEENIHPVPTEYEDFNLAVRHYERTIRSVFHIKAGEMPQFDLIILGMGADGHTGSLFPNSYASFDTENLACVVYLLDQKMPDQVVNRITLTHPVLRAASELIVLVTGSEKAPTLKEVLTCEPDEVRYPIHILWPVLDKVAWLVDSPAAKFL